MWCTRWFLPLILLPLPTAPPYLLLLFLFSLTMHARPCFYCIVLLAALFISSCYWQPLPIDSPLSTPWSANITTFSEALNAFTPNYQHDYGPSEGNNGSNKRPTVIRLMDRCWCDFSSGSFFEPFNVSTWEYASVKRLKKELVLGKERAAERGRQREAKERGEESGKNNESPGFAAPTPPPTLRTIIAISKEKKNTFETLRSVFWRAPSTTPNAPSSASSSLIPTAIPLKQEIPLDEQRRPVTSWEFDLEPYGFDLVLDFRWTRQS